MPRKDKPDKTMVGWAYDHESGYYALVKRESGVVTTTAISLRKDDIIKAAVDQGYKSVEELRFGTHMKEQITGAHMYTKGIQDIRQHASEKLQEELKRGRAEPSSGIEATRARVAKEIQQDPTPDEINKDRLRAAIEGWSSRIDYDDLINRQMAYSEILGKGHPISPDALDMSTETLREYADSLPPVVKQPNQPTPPDLEPDRVALNDKIEAAAMDHIWGEEGPEPEPPEPGPEGPEGPGEPPAPTHGAGDGGAEAVPEVDLGDEARVQGFNTQADVTLDRSPGIGEPGMHQEAPTPPLDFDPSDSLNSHIYTTTEPNHVEHTYRTDLPDHLKDVAPEERASVAHTLQYADSLKAHIDHPDNPCPTATRNAEMVMRNFPTTQAAVDRTPRQKSKSASASPTAKLTKKLGRK